MNNDFKIYNYRYNKDGDDMKDNVLIDKSIDFGARIVKLHRYLVKTKFETVLQKSDYPDEKMASSLLEDCLEIKRILIASVNTAKDKQSGILFHLWRSSTLFRSFRPFRR